LLTHDLRRARDCSRVYVLRDGKIAECGRFEELVVANGSMASMFRAKASVGS
jgi:ABC-type multidrug transport system fused ATPase/permease subunit